MTPLWLITALGLSSAPLVGAPAAKPTPAARPAPENSAAAYVVKGGAGITTTGAPLGAGQPVKNPAGGPPLALLLQGGCLLRIGPATVITLGPTAPGTRCAQVILAEGQAALFAAQARRPALRLQLGQGAAAPTVTLRHGIAVARRQGAIRGLCLQQGAAQLGQGPTPTAPKVPAPRAVPKAPAPRAAALAARRTAAAAKPKPTAAAARRTAATAAPKPATRRTAAAAAPKPAARRTAAAAAPGSTTLKAGQCAWLAAGSATVQPWAAKAQAREKPLLEARYGYGTPATRLAIDLAGELARLKASRHGDTKGGGGVEGGSQSMCLETGSEGGVADGQGTSVDITKPPPPSQLRLRITLTRRQ